MQIVNSAVGIEQDDSVKSDSQMSTDPPATLALATFDEILNAYTARRPDSGRRRRKAGETEMFPWRDAVSTAPLE
jgi:hypothetical protein